MDFKDKFSPQDGADTQPIGEENRQHSPDDLSASREAAPITPPPLFQMPAGQNHIPAPDLLVYHDQAHHEDAPPFAPGSPSYVTYQQWQAQHAKAARKSTRAKRNLKKPLLALGGMALAAALFLGGMMLGSKEGAANPSASSGGSFPTVDIANPPAGGKSSSAGGVMSGEDIYNSLNPSVVAIQSAGGDTQSGSSGSGVVMSADGFIITNAHVITDEQSGVPMTSISVLFSDGTQLPAKVYGYDHQTDLAVIKVEPSSALVAAEFGNSDALRVGEIAYAIGSPGGVQLANSMTNGIISAINRDITVNDRVMSLIQTNVTINPGNSGGALINQYGQVVGITSAKLGISYYEGLGFAIPINSAKEIIDQLIANGYIPGRPSIGITGSNISAQVAQYRNVPQGVEVASVDSRAYAAAEGLAAGDIIIGVNGQTITTMDEINEIKNDLKAGEALTLTVYRPTAQKSFDLRITLTDTHDLEGADPATEQPQTEQPQTPNQGGNNGSFNPFEYFFGY